MTLALWRCRLRWRYVAEASYLDLNPLQVGRYVCDRASRPKRVAKTRCKSTTTPWLGDLLIGQYSAGPGVEYQFVGKIKSLSITNQ